MIVKTCPHHGELLLENTNKNGECKKCRQNYSNKWRANNKEKEYENRKKYREKMLQNGIKKDSCITHGVIEKELFDKWGRCILCRRAQNKESYDKNKGKWPCRKIEVRRAAALANKESYHSYQVKHRIVRRERVRELARKKGVKYSRELYDGYIKFLLSRKFGFKRKEIDKNIIDLYRECVKIKRKIKEE